MTPIPVLFITYNRLGYSKQALASLLETKYPVKIFIWDNGSTDGTVDWLKTLDHPSIDDIWFSPDNKGINAAFNTFIRMYKEYPYLAKVDNDTVVEPMWMHKLVEVLDSTPQLDAVGTFMQRPPGQWNFQTWVDSVMRRVNLEQTTFDGTSKYLAYNSYTGGTGVLIRTQIFWEEGLLFDKYPCKLGDWTTFQRLLFQKKGGNNIAWYSGSTVKLLNIKEDGVSLNEDFPEYEAELREERDRGNAWYSSVGGAPGVERFIQDNGGRERLS